MAGITLVQAEAQLAAWLAADAALAGSQSYTITVNGSSRQLTRANAAEVRKNIEFWDGRVKSLASADAGRHRTRYVVLG
jgi:hypothetical protein